MAEVRIGVTRRARGSSCDVWLTLPDEATVGEVRAALDLASPLHVDGRPLDDDEPARRCGLGHGSQVGPESEPLTRPPEIRAHAPEAGEAGLRRAPIVPGRMVLGPAPSADARLPPGAPHVLVTVDSGPDTAVHVASAGDARLRVGATRTHAATWDGADAVWIDGWLFEQAAPLARGTPTSGPPTPLARSPVAVPSAVPEVEPPPDQPTEAADPDPPGWPVLVLPAVLGVGMAVLFSPLFAVFAIMGPVMACATWLDGRRKTRRRRRRDQAEHADALDSWRERDADRRQAEHRRWRRRHPVPSRAVETTTAPRPPLWAVRDTTEDAWGGRGRCGSRRATRHGRPRAHAVARHRGR